MNLFDVDSHDTAAHEQPPPDSLPDSLLDSLPDSALDSALDSAEALPEAPPPEHRRRRRASILWAMLLARIYEVLPLVCPRCSSPMKLIAFITHSPTIERILDHLGLPTRPPPLAPARDPPQVEMMFRPEERSHQHHDPYDQTHWP